MNIAAYCRVSTDKADQLNSLEAQKQFFEEYTKKNNHTLVRLYADEGISGTKIRNRREFLQLMRDAERGMFEMVVVKDISRFSRNTVDFLQSIRTLKALNIETVFLTSNQTVLGNSEFLLTIFSALAQEESANTSKRIKFGKRINAEQGRVPNIVFGYDKIPGDYFNLSINQKEAAVVRRIFDIYSSREMGASRIANYLNEQGITTKRGKQWSQNAVSRILTNEIYIGRISNGKEEIKDFLTSSREKKGRSEWFVTEKPELRIISDEQFEQVRQIIAERQYSFQNSHERHSSKHIFSTLIRCAECGYSFRRTMYRGEARWVCSYRNTTGAANCPNSTIISEQTLIDHLQDYFSDILKNRNSVLKNVVSEFERLYKKKSENENYNSELQENKKVLEKKRQKYMDMYVDELISREELNEKLKSINSELEKIKKELTVTEYHLSRSEALEEILKKTFSTIETAADIRSMSNSQLHNIIEKISVDKDGNIDVYLRIFGEIGLNEKFLICDNHT